MTEQQIRTFKKHQSKTLSAERDQGIRNWSSAQIMGPISFVVDICVEDERQLKIERWFTTSIPEIVHLQESYKPFQWIQVFVSMRTPLKVNGGLLFEEVSEVYQSGGVGSYIYRLTNGIVFMPQGQFGSYEHEDKTFKLVYSNQQVTMV